MIDYRVWERPPCLPVVGGVILPLPELEDPGLPISGSVPLDFPLPIPDLLVPVLPIPDPELPLPIPDPDPLLPMPVPPPLPVPPAVPPPVSPPAPPPACVRTTLGWLSG